MEWAASADGTHGERVAVIVLGDLGRSPRMQNHAAALRAAGARVDLIGYGETPLFQALRDDAGVTTHLLHDRTSSRRHQLPRALFVLLAALRAIQQASQLLRVVLWSARPTAILVQTPPAIPTLPVAWLAARWRGMPLILDWHNFSASLLALQFGRRHPLVRVVDWLEGRCARLATAHLCVSRAMRAELARRWGIEASVLYDRPAAISPASPGARREFCTRLSGELGGYDPQAPDRPALVVSSTSWTADEDFSLLLEAMSDYDDRRQRAPALCWPELLVVVTGHGLLRVQHEQAFDRHRLTGVRLRTLWLTHEDYRLLLQAADVGVCLHRSSSGVDLPMKVVDMIGAGLPVCALDYGPCLRELLQPGVSGLLFDSAGGLASCLGDLLSSFPQRTPLLETLRHNIAERPADSWMDGWRREALPLLQHLGMRVS